MKAFNKRGDSGETSLLYGQRVSKADSRCEAYGTIDEAASTLGLARHLCKKVEQDVLIRLQRDLFRLGAELACPREYRDRLHARGDAVTAEMVDDLERLIDSLEVRTEMPRAFVVPGAVVGSAALDMARAVVRRAERRVVGLAQEGVVVNSEVARYLNRLADLLFTLARYEEGESRIHV
jgi:cob(I)alamin adenosyltransferase